MKLFMTNNQIDLNVQDHKKICRLILYMIIFFQWFLLNLTELWDGCEWIKRAQGRLHCILTCHEGQYGGGQREETDGFGELLGDDQDQHWEACQQGQANHHRRGYGHLLYHSYCICRNQTKTSLLNNWTPAYTHTYCSSTELNWIKHCSV